MTYSQRIIRLIKDKNPNQPEFHQTVEEVLESLDEFLEDNLTYEKHAILERITEPERIISFRVPWLDDQNRVHVNKGYRVQFNSAIGPYKGGLRFHPTVNESILKFLGFEQIFKNSLTGLPLGGGKGGSDFDPKGKSESEVMRFSHAFMSELYKYIGDNTDIPAGDIGVGGREIGYLFGQYKKLTNLFNGVLTGKSFNWGGSRIRPEATGYGLVYFVQEMLARKKESIKNKEVLISGSGNVAQFAAEKAIALGAKVITFSDSSGTIYVKGGIDTNMLKTVMHIKNERRGRIKELVGEYEEVKYYDGRKPWNIQADIALPCATQNEINKADAEDLISNGVKLIAEGSNMSTTNEAIEIIQSNEIEYAPGKASNAGGVAVSGLEMSQNNARLQWSRSDVDKKLKDIMSAIHSKCVEFGQEDQQIDYVKGANIAGFKKVADAMIEQGVV